MRASTLQQPLASTSATLTVSRLASHPDFICYSNTAQSVIRNAGASAHDALRSIIISEQLLGTQEILLIKHTGCGMLTFKNEDAHAIVKNNLGEAAATEIEGLDFLAFPDLDAAVKAEVAWLKGKKVVPDGVAISGWIYEVETGKVKKVD
jgi:carbonic anhydrase